MRHLKMYRAIRLIARHGSIRKAAEYQAISPSALNRAVQAFEDELGQPVFERIPGGVRLSDAGELLVDMIDRHLTEFEDFAALLGNMRDGLAGTLRLSVGTDICHGLVQDTVAAFGATHPGVSVEVVQHDGIAPLVGRLVDIALLTDPATDDQVDVLFSTPVALVAKPLGFAPDDPPPAHLWEVTDHRLIVPPEGTGTRAALTHILRKHRLREGVMTSLPVGVAPARGPAVAIGPATSFDATPHPLPIALGTVQIMALRRAKAPLPRPVQAFLTLLQTALDAASPPPG